MSPCVPHLCPLLLLRCPGRATLVHSKFALSWWRSFKACMRRELTLFYRNRVVRNLPSCLLMMSVLSLDLAGQSEHAQGPTARASCHSMQASS